MVPHSSRRHVDVERVLGSNSCPFAVVGEEVRQRVASAMEVRSYQPGDLLVRQGDEGGFLLVLIDGVASACVRQADGTVTSLAELRTGGLVGEMSLVTNEPRTADVICRTPVRAAFLSVDAFDGVAHRHPELRALLTEVVADRLGRATYDSLSGKDISGYRISRCIGRGGVGIVYEAESLAERRRVALKMMNHRLLYQPRAVQRFQQEADTITLLDHPAIARLYGRFSAYRTQFLVLEFCQGPTLHRMLKEHAPLAEDVVRRIVGQIAEVLQFVHDHGVIHRDLKPSNVMLSEAGRLKLLDFSIATMTRASRPSDPDDSPSTTLECLGTPRYMAPEQFAGEELDHRVDWFGLACIAYEALTGRPTVEESDLFAIIQARRQFVLPAPPKLGFGVSAEMHEFLRNALQYHREERTADLRSLTKWAGPVVLDQIRRS